MRRDIAVGAGLTADLENKLTLRHDIEVAVYLRSLGERLAASTPTLASSPVGIFLISDRTEKWRSFGIPGNRIYLSAGLVKNLDFENELGAAVALEYAHILKRHVAARLPGAEESKVSPLSPETPSPQGALPLYSPDGATLPRGIDYFGPAGIFSFSEEEMLQSIELAIDILYKAGIDSRGMVGLWQKYAKNPSRSVQDPAAIARFLEKTRQTLALYPPLRNPIVRSDAFLTIRKRIRTL